METVVLELRAEEHVEPAEIPLETDVVPWRKEDALHDQ